MVLVSLHQEPSVPWQRCPGASDARAPAPTGAGRRQCAVRSGTYLYTVQWCTESMNRGFQKALGDCLKTHFRHLHAPLHACPEPNSVDVDPLRLPHSTRNRHKLGRTSDGKHFWTVSRKGCPKLSHAFQITPFPAAFQHTLCRSLSLYSRIFHSMSRKNHGL